MTPGPCLVRFAVTGYEGRTRSIAFCMAGTPMAGNQPELRFFLVDGGASAARIIVYAPTQAGADDVI